MLNYLPARIDPVGLCLIVAAGDLGELAQCLSERGVSTVRLVKRTDPTRATAAEALFASQREILEGLHFAESHGSSMLIIADIDALPHLLALMRGRADKPSGTAGVILIRGDIEEPESLGEEVLRRLSS